MNNKIKEILDFKEDADYKRLSVDEIIILRDYIRNLQEKVNQYENPDDMTLFYMWLDTKAKDKIRKLEIEAIMLKQHNTMIAKLGDEYKSRNEKAIKHLKEVMKEEKEYEEDYIYNKYLLDILQGSDK